MIYNILFIYRVTSFDAVKVYIYCNTTDYKMNRGMTHKMFETMKYGD